MCGTFVDSDLTLIGSSGAKYYMTMPTPDIPPDQLDRILPIVEPLLADLRRLAQELSPGSDLALVYHPGDEQLDTKVAQ